MSIKRKNDDFLEEFLEAEAASRPSNAWYSRVRTYQFYVDDNPLAVIRHLKQLAARSKHGISYNVSTSGLEEGDAFEVERRVNRFNERSRIVVTGFISPYDSAVKRTFVIVRVVLIDSFLMAVMLFLGGAAIFFALSMLIAGVRDILFWIPIFLLLPLVPTVFFVPHRRQAVDSVANHLLLLRRDPSFTTGMKHKNDG